MYYLCHHPTLQALVEGYVFTRGMPYGINTCVTTPPYGHPLEATFSQRGMPHGINTCVTTPPFGHLLEAAFSQEVCLTALTLASLPRPSGTPSNRRGIFPFCVLVIKLLFFLFLLLFRFLPLLKTLDDFGHQLVAYHIAIVHVYEVYAFDVFQHLANMNQA